MTFVALEVVDNLLDTDVTAMRCLDLNFVPLTLVPDHYFAELELVYEDLLRQIEQC